MLQLDKLTPGPVGAGTRYIEVVRLFPGVKGVIRSVITRYEPPNWLGEDFEGMGMLGQLCYQFSPQDGGTLLVQREQLQMRALFGFLDPLVERLLVPRLIARLKEIKVYLESSSPP